MGYEALKTKQMLSEMELSLFEGSGIDIGCGLDPIIPNAKPFDMDDDDANKITKYRDSVNNFLSKLFRPSSNQIQSETLVQIFVIIKNFIKVNHAIWSH